MEAIILGLTISQIIWFICWGVAGQLFYMLVQRVRSRNKITAYGGFDITFWFKDNGLRLTLTFVTIIIGVLFYDNIIKLIPLAASLGLDAEINEYKSFTLGMMTDLIINAIVKPRKV